MKEITLLPGRYYVGEDIPAGVCIFTLCPESSYANVTFEKPSTTYWYLNEPFTQARLRLQAKEVFRLDHPVTLRRAEPLDFGDE